MIAAIVARSKNNVIGVENGLPWRLPDDMKFFRETTSGKPVVMGRKTAESIVNGLGGPLPNRQNIVVTRQDDFKLDGFLTAHTIDEALELASGDDVFIIGGEQIYTLALPYCDRLYITEVDATIEGDAHFPVLDDQEWTVVSQTPHPSDERHTYSFTFTTWDRKAPA